MQTDMGVTFGPKYTRRLWYRLNWIKSIRQKISIIFLTKINMIFREKPSFEAIMDCIQSWKGKQRGDNGGVSIVDRLQTYIKAMQISSKCVAIMGDLFV